MRSIILTVTAFALSSAGCVCEDAFAVYSADWEYCQGLCDWVQEGSGSSSIVETIHPGEHGLLVTGQIALAAPVSVTTGTIYNDGVWLEYTSTCAGSPTMRWRAVESGGFTLSILLPPSPPAAGDRFTRHRVSLPPAPVDDPDEPGGEGTSYLISTLELEHQSGVCVIDQLRLMVANECYW